MSEFATASAGPASAQRRARVARSFAAGAGISHVALVLLALLGLATCDTALAADATAVHAAAVPASSSPAPQTLLEAYEKSLVPYERFRVTWTERNAELKERTEPEWRNRLDGTLVRDGNRQRYRLTWNSGGNQGRSERNWQEGAVENGKTEISVHPAPPGRNPKAPIVIGNLHASDQDYLTSLRRGLPGGTICGACIPMFLRSSKLSAQRDTLQGRSVDVLQGVSGEIRLTLWLDPAMKHVPRKIAYDQRGSSDNSPAESTVYEVKRFEEKGGVFVPVEAIETQHWAARPAVVALSQVVDGKVVLKQMPQRDGQGQIIMVPAGAGLTEIRFLDYQFDPGLADDDFRFSKTIPDGTKVSVTSEPPVRHVSYEWSRGGIVKVVAPAITGKFDAATDARAEIARRLEAAKWRKERVLVIFGANTWPQCEALDATFLSHPETLLLLVDDVGEYPYRVVFADLTNAKNRALAAEYGLNPDDRTSPGLTVLDANGRALCSQDLAAFQRDGAYDAAELDAFLKKWEGPREDADEVLHAALERAAEEQKKLFLVVTGAHCIPCHRLIGFLSRWQDALDQDYILVKIDVDRMNRAADVLTPLGYDVNGLIPWYAILSPAGEKLATSAGPMGNIGFPSQPPGIDHFMAMLRQTAAHLAPEQLKAIEEALVAANLEN